jgi:predicted PurR-regulated permease PerM
MVRKKSRDLFGVTKKQVKKLRDKVNRLKREQAKRKKDAAKALEKAEHQDHQPKREKLLVEFSMASVAKSTLVIIGLLVLAWFLFEIRQILILLFVSLFLAAALDGMVDSLEEKKIPRAVSIIGIYLIFLLVMVVFISTLIPLIASQTLELALRVRDIVTNLAQGEQIWSLPYTAKLQELVGEFLQSADQETIIANLQGGLEQLGNQLQGIAGNTFAAIKIVFNGALNAVMVMFLTFFMVVDEKGIDAFLLSLFPSRHARYIIAKSEAVKEKVGYWLRGQLKLMLAMAVLTYVVLSVLGVEYALTLAMIAGITELLPVIGPVIAAIPALLIGLNVSLMFALWILIAYIIIQQIEGNVLVPLIMNKAVGLSPLIIIIAMLIGYQFMGILGIMISVPLATAVSIFIKDYTARAK